MMSGASLHASTLAMIPRSCQSGKDDAGQAVEKHNYFSDILQANGKQFGTQIAGYGLKPEQLEVRILSRSLLKNINTCCLGGCGFVC